jgi:hypothetical protein
MPDETETITVRGKPFRVLPHDWYIFAALEAAPATWSYALVMRLRAAIRESAQHSHGLSVDRFTRPIEFVHTIEGRERAKAKMATQEPEERR